MSKTIKLEDEVYDRLENFRDKRETYSQAVERLLELPTRIKELGSILEGQAKNPEFKHGPEKIQGLQVR